MKSEAYAYDPLNGQASVLVDAQTDIKIAIKNGVLAGAPFLLLKKEVERIIGKALSRIRSPTLRKDASVSLVEFSNRAYRTLKDSFEKDASIMIAAMILASRIGQERSAKISGKYFVPKTPRELQAADILSDKGKIRLRAFDKGVPIGEFQKTYMIRVTEAFKTLAGQNALDPNDVTKRNSLRNLAEMQVRYERHQEEIDRLRETGEKIVACSVHADCSARCAPWQGRLYSLDGTSGVTKDGRRFIPLEVATDQYYTTKARKTYKNGLFGFNCRHKLVPYKIGMVIPSVSAEEQKREYAITRRQRELERDVIKYRELALMYKGVDQENYRYARNSAQAIYAKYKRFSEQNHRAYYPDRVKIL